MEPVVHNGQNDLFSGLNEARSSPWIIGDSNFRRHFCQKISWTSLKTLDIELVGPNGQNRPFSSSPSFLVIRNSNIIFAKSFHGRP
ncbi:hypothetical protein H5410_052989 [Solanum commersonii]|uniref:Uncharacterized protein n=1 Tax=Solanum commersonii TaxID=4109 RepID=A0A9J5X332_SOLCO|nr:hypothetical protein H5410_052989 [Solanum commersonii]